MAALPYIQLYIADYLADTAHLTCEEHGAYLLLIFNYWQTGKPIRKDRLSRIVHLPNDRWTGVERTLNEFFEDDGECWIHPRIEADLQAVHDAQEQRSSAGKATARPSAEVWRKIRRSIFERDDYTCQYCGKRGTRLECDHVVPVSRGGSNDQDNLATACFACNRSKRNKLVSEWRQEHV